MQLCHRIAPPVQPRRSLGAQDVQAQLERIGEGALGKLVCIRRRTLARTEAQHFGRLYDD